ncbi:hypothetical protein VFPPC_13725 [Pochonia chlamydosporia 170]|uniref:Uncharacterized protein n=1 Tax=Pochonia chlamydosporia 170 TaxID=1380566 RepID=A0A179FSW1_METCM|nr:hypothetical protein VFPPC_13725 [Pochonia chlamydosporia 170]OAQ68705.1 hypothetical protein VFPPC_13725 [Pochonia chlamydosporia 170]
MSLRITKFLPILPRRGIHISPRLSKNPQDDTGKIFGGGVGTKGRTAGGEALNATAEGAPPKPKVFNFSTTGAPGEEQGLTEEQKREVEEHNREFERTHEGELQEEGRENKVHSKFWNGKGNGKKEEGQKAS